MRNSATSSCRASTSGGARHGDLTYDADGALGLMQTASYRRTQSGFYLQGVYQFIPLGAWGSATTG